MNLVLDKLVGALQQLRGQNDDGRGAVAYLRVLELGKLNKNLCIVYKHEPGLEVRDVPIARPGTPSHARAPPDLPYERLRANPSWKSQLNQAHRSVLNLKHLEDGGAIVRHRHLAHVVDQHLHACLISIKLAFMPLPCLKKRYSAQDGQRIPMARCPCTVAGEPKPQSSPCRVPRDPAMI
eukprot:353880-Chlamydomonas_euryale.AAC.14